MADNVTLPGAASVVATDDIAGVQYQKVKLIDGTVDSTTVIAAGGGVEAGALRVTIASDSTGVVSIDDGGGAITVDGTVAVTNADLTTLAGAVSATHMQADVLTMPTVTVNAHAVTNAGTFAVQNDNVKVNGATMLAGNGVTGTGSQRVTVASNNTAFNVLTTSAITGIGHGVKVVTTAGTDVVLAASTACKRVMIQSQTDNTSLIAVGGSGVDATIATGTGIILNPGDAFEMEIDNLTDVYIDSLVNGEGVRFTYWT